MKQAENKFCFISPVREYKACFADKAYIPTCKPQFALFYLTIQAEKFEENTKKSCFQKTVDI